MSLRIFISSVQKELELERAAVAALIATDPFLLQHCVPVLFEREPPSPRPAKQPYLEALKACQVYVLMIANEYGQPDGEISATHHEYRRAQQLKLPTVVFLKGAKDDSRSPEVRALIAETKKDGYTYKRFHDREDLRPLMLSALQRMLADEFSIRATAAEVNEGEQLIEAASTFESTVLADVSAEGLEAELVNDFSRRISGNTAERISRSAGQALHARGLAVRGPKPDEFQTTAAAYLLFGPQPANRFPQCELLADAYDDVRLTGQPKGQAGINAPLPRALEQALKFVDDHTFHPRRVVGLNNVRLDEYPTAALREALVNAVAHRSYDDRSRKIFVRIFRDRIEVASPGYAPKPLTLAKLRRGGYRPCSRNPLIAQTLATLAVMEQRGSGFARMRDAMLNHGLEEPKIDQQDGFFVVTLPGPDGKYDRIRTPACVSGPVTPAIEAQLNDRQKKIMIEAQKNGSVTSGWCRKVFGVALLTVQRDLAGLIDAGLLEPKGKGRNARYVIRTTQ
ncbi:MAG TPA: ATP-binding protein [Candidatus Paceibacterota bacterium]|nr:ATP-binding protein [Verrucomicrobiota bacterium]HRY51774.1 ATP-binding protein [Candidatus Paceibacterota bacterium]HRZ56665.1 ATP-binding protein [Candidatus Paceibacterota bacterium]